MQTQAAMIRKFTKKPGHFPIPMRSRLPRFFSLGALYSDGFSNHHLKLSVKRLFCLLLLLSLQTKGGEELHLSPLNLQETTARWFFILLGYWESILKYFILYDTDYFFDSHLILLGGFILLEFFPTIKDSIIRIECTTMEI